MSGREGEGRRGLWSVSWAAVGALFVASCQSVPPEGQEGTLEVGKSYVIAHDGAPLYAEGIRSVFDQPVGTLSRGTEVELLGFDEYEARIRYGAGKEGYVPPRLLVETAAPRRSPRQVASPRRQPAGRVAEGGEAASGGTAAAGGTSAPAEVEVASSREGEGGGVVEPVEEVPVEEVPVGGAVTPPAVPPVVPPVVPPPVVPVVPEPEPAPEPEPTPEPEPEPEPAPTPEPVVIEPPEMLVDEVGILPVPVVEELATPEGEGSGE